MRIKTKKKDKTMKYIFQRIGGKSIVNKPPVISPDEESIFVIVEESIRVYSIKTGDCIRYLEQKQSDSDLISIGFPHDEEHNLYGLSENGVLTIWSWEQASLLRDQMLKLPESVKLLTFDLINSNECFVTGHLFKSRILFYATFCTKTGQMLYNFTHKGNIPYVNIISVAIGFKKEEPFAAICNGSNILYVQNLVQPQYNCMINNKNNIRVLHVTAHPVECSFVMTDALGRAISVKGNIYSRHYKEQSKESLHWHAMPLFAAAYTQEGNCLITGGLEQVLVKWTLDGLTNKSKDLLFIPRLPGHVRYITTCTSHIVVSLSNNAIVIADLLMHVKKTILECGGMSAAAQILGSSLVYIAPLKSLVLSGRPGHLQIYSTASNSVLYNVDVTQQNDISATRDNVCPLNTEVTCAGINSEGNWLVTSEYRNDGINYSEEKLKFWLATTHEITPFQLNTCVNLSHGGCKVINITVAGLKCVTSGADRKFRIWLCEKRKFSKTVTWSCLTACYYSSGIGLTLASDTLNNFKTTTNIYDPSSINSQRYVLENSENDIISKIINISKDKCFLKEKDINQGGLVNDECDMGGVGLSQDGSLIAAWFGCKLTLWDSHLCTLRTTLSHMALRPKGIDVQFGNKDAAHYLACTTQSCLAVWSLLSLSVTWIVKVNPVCLTACPFSNRMAVTTTNNDIIVFNPKSTQPIMHKRSLADPNTGVLKRCAFGAGDANKFTIYAMRNDSELFCLEPENRKQGKLEIIKHKNLPKSNFSMMIAEQQISSVKAPPTKSIEKNEADYFAKSAVGQFFSEAPHMMQSVGFLCSSFLEHLSGRHKIRPEKPEQDAMDVDPDSEDQDSDGEKTETVINVPQKAEFWTANYEEVKEKRLKRILSQPLLNNAGELFVN